MAGEDHQQAGRKGAGRAGGEGPCHTLPDPPTASARKGKHAAFSKNGRFRETPFLVPLLQGWLEMTPRKQNQMEEIVEDTLTDVRAAWGPSTCRTTPEKSLLYWGGRPKPNAAVASPFGG